MYRSVKIVYRTTMIKALFLTIIFIQFNIHFCYAERRANLSARKVLEYSLLSLKNSAQEVAQKNVWLFSENEKLRDNIRTLKAELVRLEEDKMKWIVQNASIDDINAEEQELIFFEKNASSLTNDVSKMVREQQNLEKNLDAKRSKEDEVLQEIAKVNKYIVDVQQKIDNLNIKKSKGAEDNIKEQLIEQIETSGDEIEALQRQLTKVTNNNIRPLSEAEEVSKKRSLLKQQLLIIEDELKIVLEEEDKIQKEISNVSEERESRKEELLKEIKALNDQKDSLKSILSIAKDKLKASNLNLDSGEEGERQLIENLVAIKNEKKMLLKKVSDFEKQIQEIKNK
ncbi:MAG: hypothetical protein KKF78_02535 [Candidatus Omnitrophica bacterium]|nr:hypothetical protein [Candidatus Omnitrophota bacterium]